MKYINIYRKDKAMQTLPNRLKSLRQESGLLQKHIAEQLNITTSAYGYYEQGKRIPDSNTLDKLAQIFNVSTDYILGRTDVKQSSNTEQKIFLSKKDKKDIAKDLEQFKQELLECEELLFDGEPASDETIDNILAAIEIGMEQVRRKNKAKYTPSKYKNSHS